MRNLIARHAVWAIIMVVTIGLMLGLLGGCGSTGTTTGGTLKVAITSTEGTRDGILQGNLQSVVVAIKEIWAVTVDEERYLIARFNSPKILDIMQLNYQQEVLGTNIIPEGSYKQVRLVLAPNPTNGDPLNYIILDGNKYPLTTPSGQQTGLKIIGCFTVTRGKTTAIVLNFNPQKAIVQAGQSGQWILKPTSIRILQQPDVLQQYGSLSFNLQPQDVWGSAIVYIYQQGNPDPIAAGMVNQDDGSFVAFLPPGTDYYIVIKATGYQTYNSSALDPPSLFQVIVTQNTDAGTIILFPAT